MRKLFSIFLIATLLGGNLAKFGLVLNYWINQSEIVKEFCENKDKPEMKCNGKCHLAKQLKQAEPKDAKPFTNLSEIKELTIQADCLSNNSSVFKVAKTEESALFYELTYILSGFDSKVFQPPRV